MITKFDITELTRDKDFDHRAFIRWLYDNVGHGIAVGSIYDLCKSSNQLWCWESSWGTSVVNKREFLHIKGEDAARLFSLVWL